MGARGAVYRIDLNTGTTEFYVDGLISPTGIAFDGSGNLYVASLFGEGIYRVDAGTHDVSLFLPAMMASDVEVSGSTLYATTDAFGAGQLIAVPLR